MTDRAAPFRKSINLAPLLRDPPSSTYSTLTALSAEKYTAIKRANISYLRSKQQSTRTFSKPEKGHSPSEAPSKPEAFHTFKQSFASISSSKVPQKKATTRPFRGFNNSPTATHRTGTTTTTIFYGFAKNSSKGKNQFLRKYVTKSETKVT